MWGPLEMYVYVCVNTFKCVLIYVYVYKTHLKFSTRSNHQLYLYIFVPFFYVFYFCCCCCWTLVGGLLYATQVCGKLKGLRSVSMENYFYERREYLL